MLSLKTVIDFGIWLSTEDSSLAVPIHAEFKDSNRLCFLLPTEDTMLNLKAVIDIASCYLLKIEVYQY